MAVLRTLGATVAGLLLAGSAAAEPPGVAPPTEYEVKAAYLYNFAKFVEWPAGPSRDVFVIAILGEDPFGETLDRTLRGKSIGGRNIVIRRIGSADDLGDADLLFISDSEKLRMPQIVKRLQGSAILTVGQADEFVTRGGMIGFHMKDHAVRFDVNVDRVRAAGLKMSSQLIRVALRVIASSGSS